MIFVNTDVAVRLLASSKNGKFHKYLHSLLSGLKTKFMLS